MVWEAYRPFAGAMEPMQDEFERQGEWPSSGIGVAADAEADTPNRHQLPRRGWSIPRRRAARSAGQTRSRRPAGQARRRP